MSKRTGSLGVSSCPRIPPWIWGSPRHLAFSPRPFNSALLPGMCYYSYYCPHFKNDGIESPKSDLPAVTPPVAELGFELRSLKSSPGRFSFCLAACFPAPKCGLRLMRSVMYQSCQAVGSYLASWIPRARMGLAASERQRTQIKGRCLVPPTTLGAAKGSACASPLRGAPPAHRPLPAPASFVPHQTPPGRASYPLLSLPPFQGVGLGPRHVLLLVKSRDFSSDPIPLGPSGAIPQETPLPLSSGTRTGPRGGRLVTVLLGQACTEAWARPHSCHHMAERGHGVTL